MWLHFNFIFLQEMQTFTSHVKSLANIHSCELVLLLHSLDLRKATEKNQ